MAKNRNRAAVRSRASRIGGSAVILSIILLAIFSTQRNTDIPIEEAPVKSPVETKENQKLTEPAPAFVSEERQGTEQIESFGTQKLEATAQKASAKQSSSAVKYGSMEAEVEGNNGKLTWNTLFQRHIKHFEIERSIDDETYETLGKITAEGSGTHNEKKLYEFLDNSLAQVQMPRVYYRIKQTGFDGLETYSDVIEYEFGLDLGLYSRIDKNAGGEIKVVYAADKTGPISLSFLDVSGTVIEKKNVEADFDPQTLLVDASSWEEGKYFLQLKDESTSVMEQFFYTR